jgi:hypothetical protein
VGVVITAVLVAVVATSVDSGDANPKRAEALIFGIIALYLVIFFFVQSRDLRRAEGADTQALARAPEEIENPATLDESELWAAMAIAPIDDEAVRARAQIWSSTRSSMSSARLVTLLIFLTVPPIYLLDSFVPLVVGGPIIAVVLLWRAVPLLTGRELDRAYDRVSRSMAPLGLEVTEAPTVTIEPKYVAPLRMGPRVRGALMLEGHRHGRLVVVRMPAEGVRTTSYVGLGVDATDAFAFRSRDGKLVAAEGAPAAAVEALRSVPSSTRWKSLHGEVGEGRIAIERKGSSSGDWLLDLWLAERLAGALEESGKGVVRVARRRLTRGSPGFP